VEGSRNEIVAPAREGPHTIDRVGLRLSEDDHRDVSIPRAPRLALAKAAAEVEGGDDERRLRALGELERFGGSGRIHHVEPVVGEVPGEEVPRRRLGLCKEDSGHAPKLATPERRR